MLILSRKPGESIVIDGRITVTVIRLEGDIVKLGIAAPREVPVHRQEVYEEIQRNNVEALTDSRPQLPRLSAAKNKPVAVGASSLSASAPATK
jgi:carbon storage regulator